MNTCYDQMEPQPPASASREVNYAHAKNLAEVLDRGGISILLSTYQPGKLVVIGTQDGRLELGFHNYVNLSTGRLVSKFEFKTGVDEIFDVAVVPHPGRVALRGPHATQDGQDTIWLLPSPSSQVE